MLVSFSGQVDTKLIKRITFHKDGGATVELTQLDIKAMQIDPSLLAKVKTIHGNTITGAQLRKLLLTLSDHSPGNLP